jgi:hypothetical protein
LEVLVNKWIAVCTVAGLGIVSRSAGAQEFGQPGQVVLGAERIMGVYSDHLTSKSSDGTTETKLNTTSIALLGMPVALDDSGIAYPSSTPRFALDVFVLQGLSLGGSLIYLNRSGSTDNTLNSGGTSTSTTRDAPTSSTFIFAPRIGYAAQLAPVFAIWPRAGITYAHYKLTSQNTNATGGTTESSTAADFTDISGEVMATFLPVPHVALLVGPYLDIPLGGGSKTVTAGQESTNHPRIHYLSVGLTTGLAAYF